MNFKGFDNRYRLTLYFCTFIFTLFISGFTYGQDYPSYEIASVKHPYQEWERGFIGVEMNSARLYSLENFQMQQKDISAGMSLVQCGNLVELGKVVKTNDQINSGSIEILIRTDVDFSCQLLAYTGSKKELVDERKDKGDKILKFENLSGKYAYRVVVRFKSDDFLCSNKVLDNIILKEK